MMIERELPRTVGQTVKVAKSMLMIFSNPNEFVIVNLLPQGTSFTAVSFADTAIIPLAGRHAQQRGDITCCKLHLHVDNSKCQTIRRVQE
jgi:hypothetical protein